MNLVIDKKICSKVYIVIFLIYSVLVLTSCNNNCKDSYVHNELPTYNYSVWIYDRQDQLITQNAIIDNEEDLDQIRVFFQNHCSDEINIGFLIFVNGFMIDIPYNNNVNKVFNISLEPYEEKELIIEPELDYIIYEENKVSLVFLTENDVNFIDEIEPIKNYTSTLTFKLLSNPHSLERIQPDIYDKKYMSNPISETYPGLSPDSIKKINGTSVNAVIMPSRQRWFTYQPHNIFINTANSDSFNDFLLNLFAEEGEYVTVVFAEGLPIPAFNNKYYLYWETDGESMISVDINLSNVNIESLENIFTLTVPIDKEKTYIYDSVKTNVYNWDQNSKTEVESKKTYFVKLMDADRNVLNPDQDYDYLGGAITYLYSYHQRVYHTKENHRIMVLVNGMPQPFKVNDREESLYYDYTIEPNEFVEFVLYIDPKLESGEKEFNISVVTLYDCEDNMFNESSLATSLLHRMGVHYIVKVNNNLSCLDSYLLDKTAFVNCLSSASSESDRVELKLYTDYNLRNTSSSGYVFVPFDSDCGIYMDIINYEVSSYSLFIICNGKFVEFENGKNILLFSIDKDRSVYSFKFEIPKKYIGKDNSLLFIISKIHKEKLSYNDLNYRCSRGIRLSVTTFTNPEYIQPIEVILNSNDNNTFVNVNMGNIRENRSYNIYSTTILADSNNVTNITPRLWFENNKVISTTDLKYSETILSSFYFMHNLLINSYGETESIYVAKYKTYRG